MPWKFSHLNLCLLIPAVAPATSINFLVVEYMHLLWSFDLCSALNYQFDDQSEPSIVHKQPVIPTNKEIAILNSYFSIDLIIIIKSMYFSYNYIFITCNFPSTLNAMWYIKIVMSQADTLRCLKLIVWCCWKVCLNHYGIGTFSLKTTRSHYTATMRLQWSLFPESCSPV